MSNRAAGRDEATSRQRKRPRIATAELQLFDPKFEPVICKNVNASFVPNPPDPAHVLATMMLRHNREAFLADARGKLSWANGAPSAN